MLIVEDGTGVVDANSYVSLAEASNFIEAFLSESFVAWSAKTELQQQATLIQAAKYLDSMLRWQSTLYKATQGLEWPRTEFVDLSGRTIVGVPDLIKESQIRLAIESMERPLYEPEARIVIDTYGNSSQTFANDGVVDGTGVTQDIRRMLVNRGFGRSGTTIITFERA